MTAADLMNSPSPTRSKAPHFSRWFPFAVAACLMALAIGQAAEVSRLRAEVAALQARAGVATADIARLRDSNALISLRLTMLDAKDAAYSGSRVLVAWDPSQHRGMLEMERVPPPTAGHDYQLWVLDPNAPAPVSAGVVTVSRPFLVGQVGTPNPGFAISLEPAGGSSTPAGPILFAVAPAQ